MSLFRFGILAFCLLAAPVQASASADRFAVIIGNNIGRPYEGRLAFAEQDAERMAAVLRRLGGVAAQNMVLLLGESANAIRQALLEVNARIRTEKSGDRETTLVVYYSGHADAEGLHPGPQTLRYDEMRAMVTGSPARVRVLILDGCRSGGLTNVKGATSAAEFALRTANGAGVEGLAMISSSAAGEDSHESDRLEASFFSHHLLSGLQGAGDENGDGSVTLNEVYTYAYHNTLRSSGRTISLQHPTYAYDIKGRGELVMTRLFAEKQRSGHLTLPSPGLYLIAKEEEGGEVIAEVAVMQPNTHLALPADEYFVQRRDEDHYREYRVSLEPGGKVSLAGQEYKEISYARLVRKGSHERTAVHGAFLLAHGRGGILSGQGPVGSVMVGYGLDLEWASIGVRARFGRSFAVSLDSDLSVVHSELAGGITAVRFFDLPWFSFGLGLLVELVHHHQSFSGIGRARPRSFDGVAFGALAALELVLTGPLSVRLEGGPATYVLRKAKTVAGAVQGDELTTPLTGWAAVGLGWRF